MIIRPITPKDLDALMQIAVESGPGFTSLMPDRDALSRKIDHSVESFARTVTTPGDEHYLFVLEDSATGQIMGTTGIEAAAGLSRPLGISAVTRLSITRKIPGNVTSRKALPDASITPAAPRYARCIFGPDFAGPMRASSCHGFAFCSWHCTRSVLRTPLLQKCAAFQTMPADPRSGTGSNIT